MNSKTSRLFRQVKANPYERDVNKLRAAWHAAPSSRARGRVNAQLRDVVKIHRFNCRNAVTNSAEAPSRG